MINKFQLLKVILFFGYLDVFSILLLIIFYVTGIDIVFFVNINFIIIFLILLVGILGRIKNNLYLWLLFLLLILSLLKLMFIVIFDQSIHLYYVFTYFYSLLLMIIAFIFVSRFSENDYNVVLEYFKTYAYIYLLTATVLLLLYIILYFSGKIAYFGMGSNLHLVIPFFMKNGSSFFIFYILLIILSGKRAVLINYILQYFIYSSGYFRKRKLLLALCLFLFTIASIYLYKTTDLFYRFEGLFNVDFNDEYSRLVAFGGRFEEVVGVYNYFKENVWKFFLGSAPGEYYMFVLNSHDYFGIISNAYNEPKNYSHLTFMSFIFRYGILFTLLIMFYIIYVMVKYYNPANEFYIVFIGIVTSSFFGANLLTEPISWLLIAFFMKYKHIK